MSKSNSFSRVEVITIMVELGFKTATKWNDERLAKKVGEIGDLVDDDTETSNGDLLASLLDADPKTIAFTDGDATVATKTKKPKKNKKSKPAAEETTVETPAKPAKKSKKTKPPAAAKPETTTTAKPAKKSKKKAKPEAAAPATKKPAKAAKPAKKEGKKKPGVIKSLVEFLTKATAKRPLSKDALLEKLVARFPDREPESMKNTISAQISYHLKAAKGLDVIKNDKGYYID